LGAVETPEAKCQALLNRMQEPKINDSTRYRCPCHERFTKEMRRNWRSRFNLWFIRCYFTRTNIVGSEDAMVTLPFKKDRHVAITLTSSYLSSSQPSFIAIVLIFCRTNQQI